MVDTLAIARSRHPGASNSLDALCKRYGIDLSRRTKHGALIDSEILAELYIELICEKQSSLGLQTATSRTERQAVALMTATRPAATRLLSEADVERHKSSFKKAWAEGQWAKYS
jgi:DNA polymerase-3 subunit epsilon